MNWLWYPYIALGKITLLQGDPGDGKSTMMINLIPLSGCAFAQEQQRLQEITEPLLKNKHEAAAILISRVLTNGPVPASEIKLIMAEYGIIDAEPVHYAGHIIPADPD